MILTIVKLAAKVVMVGKRSRPVEFVLLETVWHESNRSVGSSDQAPSWPAGYDSSNIAVVIEEIRL